MATASLHPRRRIVDVGTFDELCPREPDFAQLVALAQLSSSDTLPGR